MARRAHRRAARRDPAVTAALIAAAAAVLSAALSAAGPVITRTASPVPAVTGAAPGCPRAGSGAP